MERGIVWLEYLDRKRIPAFADNSSLDDMKQERDTFL